jgi:hypothetical protein
VAGQQLPGLFVGDRAAAQRHHAVVVQRPLHHRALERPEGLLAVLDEDVADRLAGDRGHLVVGVQEADVQPVREQRADAGLAGTRWPDEDRHRPAVRLARHGRSRVSR